METTIGIRVHRGGVRVRRVGTRMGVAAGLAVLLVWIGGASLVQAAELDRSVLPIPEPKRPTYSELDARNATPPPLFQVEAPAGAPNVLIVLIDDVGFGAAEPFGGPVPMPALDRLADAGLRYDDFHTTALCSPT